MKLSARVLLAIFLVCICSHAIVAQARPAWADVLGDFIGQLSKKILGEGE
jgi:hypothetical protein